MSDFPHGDSLRPWLEAELGRQLSPVHAPDSLWSRVAQPAARPRWVLWPVITVALLVASCILVWQIGRAHGAVAGVNQLSTAELQALADDSRGIALKSSNPAEIRKWLKLKAGINVDLAFGERPPIRLLGARLIPASGGPIATVAFRAGKDNGTLVIAHRQSFFGTRSEEKHFFSRVEPKLVAWSMHGQDYAITFANAYSSEACRLCHAEGRTLTVLN